jgi:hypothetical protein
MQSKDLSGSYLGHERPAKRLFERYVGITIDRGQFNYAQNRLASSEYPKQSHVDVFCADAAKPETWDAKLSTEIENLSISTSSEMGKQNPEEFDCWILALDTMYHFSPSRQPILKYARTKLNASIMAFDLLLSNDTTPFIRLVMSLIAVLMSCPHDTFKTEKEYRNMLQAAGYKDNQVEMKDISEYVFTPLTNFLNKRERALEEVGWSLGKLTVAKWMFGWWAKSRCIRGVIVVAKK